MNDEQGSQTLSLQEAIAETEAIMEKNGISTTFDAQCLPESPEKSYLLVLLSMIYRQVKY